MRYLMSLIITVSVFMAPACSAGDMGHEERPVIVTIKPKSTPVPKTIVEPAAPVFADPMPRQSIMPQPETPFQAPLPAPTQAPAVEDTWAPLPVEPVQPPVVMAPPIVEEPVEVIIPGCPTPCQPECGTPGICCGIIPAVCKTGSDLVCNASGLVVGAVKDVACVGKSVVNTVGSAFNAVCGCCKKK